MGAPFSLDPSATAAFAKLEQDVGAQALHDTAAPVKAVVIGGGTGAPVSIRTLLSLEADTSAVVAMADDGGSTGILREEAGVLPPGDIRKCLVAMAAHEGVQIPFFVCAQPYAGQSYAFGSRRVDGLISRGHRYLLAIAEREGACLSFDAR